MPVKATLVYHCTLLLTHVAIKTLLPPLHIVLGVALIPVGLAGEVFTVILTLVLALVHVPLSHTA